MADTGDGGLFREIDEELRQEHYEKLWKQYGKYIIALAVLLILGVAGYQGWKSYDRNNRLTSSDAFVSSLRQGEKNPTDAETALRNLAKDGASGYALLARFHEAALLAKSGKRDEAGASYRTIASLGSAGALYQDLATLMESSLLLDDGLDDDLNKRLSALMADSNPWRHAAKELVALAALAKGETEKARTLLKTLADDKTAPESLRSRAGEILKGLPA